MVHNLEIYEFITMLDEFFEREAEPIFDIGEMVGCNLLRYVADAAVKYVQFNNILFVSGTPDAAYASERKNFVYWKWLFTDFIVDNPHDTFDPLSQPTFKYNKSEYVQKLIPMTLKNYSIIIINQAQLIPRLFLDIIAESFSGQIVRIYDPFDLMGQEYDVPLRCVDTFESLPATIGYARSLYGIDTRNINKRAKNTISIGSIRKRSIGKIDDNQYVTDDFHVLDDAIDKQKAVPFRKNQKIFITDNKFNIVRDSKYEHVHSLGYGTLLHILQGSIDGSIRCRIHSSKAEFDLSLAYEFKPFITPSNTIIVSPANVITPGPVLNEHYFKQIVYVTTSDNPLISIRTQYTLIKQSQNLIIAKTK